MRRILITLSLLGVLSCKTSGRSRLDSAMWMEGDLAKLIYFEKDTFVVKSCSAAQDGSELKDNLRNKKNLDELKKLCNQFSTAVSPSELKSAITAAIKDPADSEIGATKQDRLNDIPVQIKDLKAQLSKLNETISIIEPEDREIFAPELLAQISERNAEIAKLENESKQLEEAAKDPAKLKAIDINTTLALQSKIASEAVSQANIFVEMLADLKIYTLDKSRDTTLIAALSKFSPTCSNGMNSGVRKRIDRGVEVLDVYCDINGNLKVESVNCSMPGYEYKALNDNPKSCIFTGKDLQTQSLTATHDGMCAINQKGSMSCWGKVGRFPLNTELSSLANLSFSKDGAVKNIVSSAQQLCVFNDAGNLSKCWPFNIQGPESSISFKALTGGESHMCGLTSNQDVKCWGQNDYKQLDIPGSLKGIQQISTLENVSCVVDGGNKVQCWGTQVDQKGPGLALIPAKVSDARSVSVGPNHACALLATKKIVCWGDEVDASFVPSNLPPAAFVASGRYESCAITTDGDLKCWGKGPQGRAYKTAPQLKNVKNIIVSRWGANFCAIYDADRKLSCWGSEIYNEPYKIDPPSDLNAVKSVAITSSGYACASTDNGKIRCFGNTSDIPSGPN